MGECSGVQHKTLKTHSNNEECACLKSRSGALSYCLYVKHHWYSISCLWCAAVPLQKYVAQIILSKGYNTPLDDLFNFSYF